MEGLAQKWLNSGGWSVACVLPAAPDCKQHMVPSSVILWPPTFTWSPLTTWPSAPTNSWVQKYSRSCLLSGPLSFSVVCEIPTDGQQFWCPMCLTSLRSSKCYCAACSAHHVMLINGDLEFQPLSLFYLPWTWPPPLLCPWKILLQLCSFVWAKWQPW